MCAGPPSGTPLEFALEPNCDVEEPTAFVLKVIAGDEETLVLIHQTAKVGAFDVYNGGFSHSTDEELGIEETYHVESATVLGPLE